MTVRPIAATMTMLLRRKPASVYCKIVIPKRVARTARKMTKIVVTIRARRSCRRDRGVNRRASRNRRRREVSAGGVYSEFDDLTRRTGADGTESIEPL